MHDDMIKVQPFYLRYSLCQLCITFHNYAILIKIQIAPQIIDTACQRLLIDINMDRVPVHNGDIHGFNERNILDFFFPIQQG